MTIATLSNENSVTQPVEMEKIIKTVGDTLAGVLDWDALDRIWNHILEDTNANWHLYNNDNPLPGDNRPSDVVITNDLSTSIQSLNAYLHQAHPRDYCGMVFADSLTEPTLIRIFDPKYLTSMCNIYGNTPAPSWVLSTMDPAQLATSDMTSSKLQDHSLGKALPSAPEHTQIVDSLDARRMGCPLPLVHTARSLRKLAIGEILEIVTIDPGSINDIEYLCECTGSKHLALAEGEYGYSFYIERKKEKETNITQLTEREGE